MIIDSKKYPRHIRSLLSGILFFTFMSGTSFAQHLNASGHFNCIGSDENLAKRSASAKNNEVRVENIILQGNSVFKTPHGFVTLSGDDENSSSTVRIYTIHGKEIFSKSFLQTINFKFSPDKNFCAFHDSRQICLINLSNQKVTTFQGSNVFAVNDSGQLAWFDDKNSTINFKESNVKINEVVYDVLFFNAQPLFITKKNILMQKNNSAEPAFTIEEGRFFYASVFGDKLYVSIKKEQPEEFIFNSLNTTDLLTFTPVEEVHYPLAHHQKKKSDYNPGASRSVNLDSESILDPLYYYNDTVYQPVGNSYDEMQEYSPGDIYPHPGVDLLGTFMQDVYAVKKAYVKAILTTSGQYHWRIAVSNQNTSAYSQGYLYAHLEETSIPYAVGDSADEGDVLGQLVDFPVTGFVHCHFARIIDQGVAWNGDWWTFDNPLSYMTNFFDSIPPEFEKTIGNDEFAFRDVTGNYLSPDSLYGNVKVISKVFDRINAEWHCDVNKLQYNVSPLASPQTMLLDSFAYEYNFFNDFYFGGAYYTGLLNTIYSRDVTCFTTADYTIRDFYHIVTNSDGNDTINSNDSMQVFNTLSLPDGSYIFRIIASDPSGNATTDSMIIQIKNMTVNTNDFSPGTQAQIFPNPFLQSATITINKPLINATLSVYNSTGQEVRQLKNISGQAVVLHRANLSPGIYFVRMTEGNETLISGKLVVASNQ
jgi:hypothetical protein